MKHIKAYCLIIIIVLSTSLSGCIIDGSEKWDPHPPMKW